MTNDVIKPLSAAEYNYAEFTLETYEALNTWAHTPEPGKRAPDFPLWRLSDKGETSLRATVKQHALCIIEFGSLT